jgi:hypothetical protein
MLYVTEIFLKLLAAKVRRLYDIANILSSLQLIEKVYPRASLPACETHRIDPPRNCSWFQ